MKLFSLEKYDDFILSTFKKRGVRYFFLSLPKYIIIFAALAILISINSYLGYIK